MPITWIKLSVTMFDDDKIKIIDAMPERDALLIIWIKLLAQAGKCNADGHLVLSETIPLNDEILASLFNRPLVTLRVALQTFERLGMITRIDTNDTQSILSITNWNKHQNIEALDKIREQTRIRVQNYRQNKLIECNVTSNADVTLRNAPRIRSKNKNIDPISLTDFDTFRKHYPNKKNGSAAAKAWAKLKPDPGLVATIMSAVAWQSSQPDWLKDSGKYVPHASTWLNNRRWEDEAPTDVSPGKLRRLQVAL
ncbi:MAG: phage replisome organizer N-terminal domain-containing protein [Desulfuromonadaceae bacterium]|nr:phage replisome organizer N-terminal domain-containing protein [Desulfuromonadaceae bacterium]